MDEYALFVGLVGALFASIGVGITSVKKEKLANRVGGVLSLAGAACFLVIIIGKLLGKL